MKGGKGEGTGQEESSLRIAAGSRGKCRRYFEWRGFFSQGDCGLGRRTFRVWRLGRGYGRPHRRERRDARIRGRVCARGL